ncbi:tyrosine-protein phosphatase [Streptomyces sp. NPDC059442]|uniref:tyrosine-protein phosphatase n=1 Tax=Streptomyces sp. NPDC059442 TaxID=3346830 RepID=UPI0036CC9059
MPLSRRVLLSTAAATGAGGLLAPVTAVAAHRPRAAVPRQIPLQGAVNVRDLAEPGGGPLLYHCTSGKDRTGWTSHLLLTVLGVPESTAVGDYLASNTLRAAYDARVREGLRQGGLMQNPELIVPLQEVRTEYLDAALAEVRSGYGGLLRYLTVGLGLELRTLAALRARLVD